MVAIETLRALSGKWRDAPAWGRRYDGLVGSEKTPTLVLANDQIPGEPEPVTVCLHRDPAGGAGYELMLRARVTFGVGTATITAVMDWDACQFSVPASTIRVEAFTERGYYRYPGPDLALTPSRVSITALLAKGGAPNPHPPTYTTPRHDTPASLSNWVRVPAFARRVMPMLYQPAQGLPGEVVTQEATEEAWSDWTLEVVGAGGRVLTVPNAMWSLGGAMQGLQLPHDSSMVRFWNMANTRAFALVFTLGL